MRKSIIALGLAMVIAMAAERAARADVVQPCTINMVEVYSAGLIIQCAEITPQGPSTSWLFAYVTGQQPANCPSFNIDTLKMIESVSISMRLAGKQGTAFYNTSGTSGCNANVLVGLTL